MSSLLTHTVQFPFLRVKVKFSLIGHLEMSASFEEAHTFLSCVESRDVAKYPTVYRTIIPTNRELSGSNFEIE